MSVREFLELKGRALSDQVLALLIFTKRIFRVSGQRSNARRVRAAFIIAADRHSRRIAYFGRTEIPRGLLSFILVRFHKDWQHKDDRHYEELDHGLSVKDVSTAVDLADHLSRLGYAKVVGQLADENAEHVLCQSDGFDVWEKHVVEHIRAAWEKSQAQHAEDDLVGAHLVDLSLNLLQVTL